MQIRIPKLSSKNLNNLPTQDNPVKCSATMVNITRYFFSSCKFKYVIHIDKINSIYTGSLYRKDWLVTDGTKVIGWMMNGHFHNYAEVYDI